MPDKLVTIQEYNWQVGKHCDLGLPIALERADKHFEKQGRVVPPATRTGFLTALAQEMDLGVEWYEVNWSKNFNRDKLDAATTAIAGQDFCSVCGFPGTKYVCVARCNGHSGMGCGEFFCDECMEGHMSSDCFAEDTPEHEEPKRTEGPY